MYNPLLRRKYSSSNKYLKRFVLCLAFSPLLYAPQGMSDIVHSDEVIIVGSLCVGVDCVNGESFNYDTIRLKENNVRIKFQDTSSSSSFPTVDWQLTANDSSNGGQNYFAIEDAESGKKPFLVSYGADDYSLYVRNNNYVGFNTNVPAVTMQVTTGNSPTLRLDQDGSGGFAAQAWDVAGNETNFFIRDVTNGGTLPFRIRAGAPAASIYVDVDGDIGFETTSPDGIFDIAHPTNVNNHAVLVTNSALFGINIDNSFVPRGLFDVQTTNGTSRFTVQSDGKVGIGLGSASTANGLFDVQIGGASKLLVTDSGDVGVGTASPAGRFHVKNVDASKNYLLVDGDGTLVLGQSARLTYFGLTPSMDIYGSGTHTLFGMRTADDSTTASIAFKHGTSDDWQLMSRSNFDNSNGATASRFGFFNSSGAEVLTVHQNGSLYIGNSPGLNNNTSHTIETTSGAHLTTGGVWTNASSRRLKHRINILSTDAALAALDKLVPVTFEYLSEPDEEYAGFIAEDVPDIVATNDRKSLSPMDLIAVLTGVVKEQQEQIKSLEKSIKQISIQMEK